MTCHRFGRGRLDALFFRACLVVGRDRSRPAKAVTGHRTPNLELITIAERQAATAAIDAPTYAAVLLVSDVFKIEQEL